MSDNYSQEQVNGIQESIIEKAKKDFPDMPDWIDTRDTVEGNTVIFVNTFTGNETEVGLCNLRGFLQGVQFMSKF